MPLYAWQGIDLLGTERRGTMSAATPQHLDTFLISQNIALIKVRTTRFWFAPVRQSQMLYIVQSLAALLKSGISLSQALKLLTLQTKKAPLQTMLSGISLAVDRGAAVHEAFEQQVHNADAFLLQLIEAGEASGLLADTFEAWAQYTEELASLKAQIRQAVMMPLVTFGAFCIISTLIIVVMVPMFATLLQSAGQKPPESMQTLLVIKDVLTSWGMITFLGCFIMISVCFSHMRAIPFIAYCVDWTGLHIPFISYFIKKIQYLHILQTVGILTSNGVALVPALEVVQRGINHTIFKERLTAVIQDVTQGSAFSDAVRKHNLFSHDIDVFIDVGQESGKLGIMLLRAVDYTKKQLLRRLHGVVRGVQPILLLILGLLIAALIIAVYVPIVSISYSVV